MTPPDAAMPGMNDRRPTASEIMTPGPRTLSPSSTVAEAVALLREGAEAVPVLDAGRPVGLVTERDLARADRPDGAGRPVSEVMTKRFHSVERSTPFDRIRNAFADESVGHVLVVDPNGNLSGIIARRDLTSHTTNEGRAKSPDHPARAEARDDGGASTPRHAESRDHRSPWTNPAALWGLLKTAGSEWMSDKAPRLGAALAYYTVFSVAPLILIAISIAGLVFGKKAAQGHLVDQLRKTVGPQGARAIESMIAGASRPEAGYTASVVGVVLLLIGAMGLFGQLQDAMNTVWEVEPKPGRGIWGFIKDRFLSLSMVMGTAFLLMVSLVVSATLAAMAGVFGHFASGAIGQALQFVIDVAVIAGLFAMIFRYLPDAKVAWSDVWLGATITSVLFAVGKLGIGLYIGRSGLESTYGAAGSLIALLVWMYYSAQIFLFGAEFTRAYADRYGSRIVPEPDAQRVTPESRAEQGVGPVKATA